MARLPQIHGALLEEIVLKLLRQAGYRQVRIGEEGTSPGPSGLEVQGRGAPHQIDALVTPIHSHSFIYRIRLIVEAKCESRAVGVDIIWNLVGTLLDLNQNFITWDSGGGKKLSMQRYNYHGALFAANGYSRRAERYALAHQIFLIDYSNVSLLRPVIDALVSLNLSDFGVEADDETEFTMSRLRESFERAIALNGDVAPDEVFAEKGLAKQLRERLLPALENLNGSYYGMIQGIYPVHLVSRRPIAHSLILREGVIPCEIRVSEDSRIWAFEPSGIDPTSGEFFHLEFSLPEVIANVLLAVNSRPRANEVLMPSARLFSLLHRLFPVAVLSSKIPLRGRIRKESVKVCTPKSPPSTDNSPFNLATLHIFAQRARAESQHLRCFAQSEQTISNRRRVRC